MSTIKKKALLPPDAIVVEVKNSSQIQEVAYVPSIKMMYVNFKSNDSVYSYTPVEQKKFEKMIDSPSIGAYFHGHFKKSNELKVTSI